MKSYLLWGSLAMCLFAIWVMARRDWLRLSCPTCHATARVIGHRSSWSDGRRVYAAILRFSHVAGTSDVVDQMLSSSPRPPVGAFVEVNYPEGHPDLARPPRVLMWLAIYGLLIALAAIILIKAMGW